MAFLTRHDLLNKERLPEALDKPILKKALNVLEVMNFSPEEREAYEDHLKWLRIEANTLKKYQSIGFEEGFGEGKIEGINEGVQKVARVLLADGMAATRVAQWTGLTVEEIKALSET